MSTRNLMNTLGNKGVVMNRENIESQILEAESGFNTINEKNISITKIESSPKSGIWWIPYVKRGRKKTSEETL